VFDLFITQIVETAVILGLAVLALAFKETQTEGENPWAGALPCLRKKVGWFPKEITGYHIGLVSYTLMLSWFVAELYTLVLMIYGVVIPQGLSETLKLMFASSVILLATFEDFSWHIVHWSKKYGIHTFLLKDYPAFKDIYLWILPIDYYFALFLSFGFALWANLITEWLVFTATLLFLAVIATVISMRYKYNGA